MEKTEYTGHADKLAHARSEMLLASRRKKRKRVVFFPVVVSESVLFRFKSKKTLFFLVTSMGFR